MVTEEYLLSELHCADCAAKIEANVSALAEVNHANLNFITKTLKVEYLTPQPVEQKVRNIINALEPGVKLIPKQREAVAVSKTPVYLPLVSAGIGVAVLIASRLALQGEQQLYGYILAYLFCSGRVLYQSLLRLLHGNLLDEHFLMAIASVGAMLLGDYQEACAVMVLYEIGQYFELKAVNQSRNSIESMLKLKPDKVHLLQEDRMVGVLLEEVRVGQSIVVLPGERIPLDGVITQGQSSLDTSALTGEAMPLAVDVQDKIMSGTLNLSGRLTVKVTSTDADSTVTRILKLVEYAALRKSRAEKFVTRFARIYTPAVVLAALFIALALPAVLNQPFSMWLERALIFLIVSCPCALVISIPLTNYASIGAAARKGILLKGSNFIDALARVKTFVYDKTGTVTTGRLTVDGVLPQEGIEQDRLIRAALACEESSTHPLAQAVKQAFHSDYEAEQVMMLTEYHGKGVRAELTGKTYLAGNYRFMQEQQVQAIPPEPVETCIYVAEGNICLGIITFRDDVKQDFANVIQRFKNMGIKNHLLLTGDHAVQAKQVADALGLTGYEARLLPDEKLQSLQMIESRYGKPVAFVGDGLNDAPVLTAAEIGIAMGAIGNQASIEAADVVLMQDEPMQLLTAVKMARRTQSILWQNIFLALGIKLGVMALGTVGLANLWEAVIADVGVTLLAVANAMRLLRKER